MVQVVPVVGYNGTTRTFTLADKLLLCPGKPSHRH